MSALLRVPLLGKLLGANLVLVVAFVVMHWVLQAGWTVTQMTILLVASLVVSSTLVWLALRPVAELENVAERVSQGDVQARVPASPLADRDITRLSETMNRLLDRVNADRARIEYLAGRSVRARDIERESVARELRDSLAQTSAGLAMEISAARQRCPDPDAGEVLSSALVRLGQLTEDLRSVAETLYPGTLGEFGLLNAIKALARRAGRRSGLDVTVDAGVLDTPLPPAVASALYRVADEALSNAEQHGNATHVRIVLRTNGHIGMDIEDDGRGIDMTMHDPMRAGLGLFSARAVLALVGGELQIHSAPAKGTRVCATVPLQSVTRAA
jgi:signal transduction histidine kinase